VKLLAVLLAVAACSHGAPSASDPPPSPPLLADASDVVLAVADSWTSTTVTLSHWQRDKGANDWFQLGHPWPGVVGHSGLAWGSGLHGDGAPKGHAGPIKREGDGASPAGAFRITGSFGYVQAPGRRVLTETTECVDDPKSSAYNTIVEHTGSADWSSSEHMRRPDDLYSIGAVVDHNPARVPGGGSCIFLHVWDGPDSTTVGCTAMDHIKLAEALGTLGANPVFVLLPRAEYEALRKPWGLPAQ
jgi:D-alanyl-D-alanine dipeptidase